MAREASHSYEEIRNALVDVLLKRVPLRYDPNQLAHLEIGVAQVLEKGSELSFGEPRLGAADEELVRDVFWDLFREGFITPGLDAANPNLPFFRLSHYGQKALLTQSPYRFHDTSSYLAMVRKEVPDISAEAVAYLDEAIAALYAGCLLASCVMLGVASEAEFLRLLDVAVANAQHGQLFVPAQQERFVRAKITKFQSGLAQIVRTLPRDAVEDLETNFLAIQSILRIARNEAGHPSAASPQREQVYVYLQLFVPFARQLMRLRAALGA